MKQLLYRITEPAGSIPDERKQWLLFQMVSQQERTVPWTAH